MLEDILMLGVMFRDLKVIHQVLCNINLTAFVWYMGKHSAEQFVSGLQTMNYSF